MPFYAVCPYFKYEKKKMVGCEYNNIVFPEYEDKAVWMTNLCCSFDYKYCAHAKELEKKYTEKYGEF